MVICGKIPSMISRGLFALLALVPLSEDIGGIIAKTNIA